MEETIFRSGLQEEEEEGEVVVNGAAEYVSIREPHFPPGSVVCLEGVTEVSKDIQRVHSQHSPREGMQDVVELLLHLFGAAHWASVSAEDSGGFGFPKRQTRTHDMLADVLRRRREPPHDFVTDDKGGASVTSL
nr:unnamed protein product [Spirometra erinaceieuropaei]